MKSEHRHQLETNLLAARIANSLEGLKPYSGQILTGLLVLLVLYAGLALWNSQAAEQEKSAWEAYALAIDTADPELKSLQAAASNEEYNGTAMQEWAYAGWADRQVLIAMQSALLDREKTKDLLRGVTGVYEQLSSSANDPQVMNRARFGLARVYELQNKIDEARQQYLTVRGDLQTLAAERAEQLDTDRVREASSWLATAELPKRDLTGGLGATGDRPAFEANLPSAQAANDGISADTFKNLLGDAEDEQSSDENRYGDAESEAVELNDADTNGEDSAAGEASSEPSEQADPASQE